MPNVALSLAGVIAVIAPWLLLILGVSFVFQLTSLLDFNRYLLSSGCAPANRPEHPLDTVGVVLLDYCNCGGLVCSVLDRLEAVSSVASVRHPRRHQFLHRKGGPRRDERFKGKGRKQVESN